MISIKPHARCDHEYHKARFAIKTMSWSELLTARKVLNRGNYYNYKNTPLLPEYLALVDEALKG